MANDMPLVKLDELHKVFPVKQGILDVLAKKPKQCVNAVDGGSL